MKEKIEKDGGWVYLGDGLYAKDDGFHFWLATSDGRTTTNIVALESNVLDAFFRFIESKRPVRIRVEEVSI